MGALLYAPGILVYLMARRADPQPAFGRAELLLALAIIGCAIAAAWLMWTGDISPL